MNVATRSTLLAMVMGLAACGGDAPPDGSVDAGTSDGGLHSGARDAGPVDAGEEEDAPRDASVDASDAGSPDVGESGDPCGGEVGERDRTVMLGVEGLTRRFRVHLPTAYDGTTPTPVVLNFHGRLLNGTQQEYLSQMNDKADEAGFVAVHPEGVSNTFNAGICCGDAMTRSIDDVAFTAALLDSLEASVCVDTRRIYSTGLSNGGLMSHRLGCELADRIAAIAPVSGTNGTVICTPSRTMPVLHFHGTADTITPYGGFGARTGVRDTMNDWVRRNECDTESAVYFENGDVSCEEWTGCTDEATVRLCTVEGGGHQWPGGRALPGLGHKTDDVSATDAMWTFFQMHSL